MSEEILEGLVSGAVSIKKKAVFNAGNKKMQEALPILIELLKNDSDNVVRNSAAKAIGRIVDPSQFEEILPVFEVALNDSNLQVRANVCWSLGNLKDPRAIPLLSKMVDPSQRFYTMSADKNASLVDGVKASDKLRDEGIKSSDVIIAAVKALGKLKSTDGIPALLDALADEADGSVRCAAALAIGKIKLNASDKEKYLKTLTQELITALNDQYWYVRRDAAKGLMKLKDPASAKALSEKLGDMYDEVKEYSLKALIKIGMAAPEEILLAFFKYSKNPDLQNFVKKNFSKQKMVEVLRGIIKKTRNEAQKQKFQKIIARFGG